MLARIKSDVFYEYLGNGTGETIYAVPDGIRKIADGAFERAENLEEIILPDSVEEIGGKAFYNCKSLKRIRLPGRLERLCWDTFCGCENLEKIEFPSTLKRIGARAFRGCRSLREVEFPEELEVIDVDAFEYCTALQTIRLPKRAKIYLGAFSYCACREVFVPENVLLDVNAFGYMFKLERIVLAGELFFSFEGLKEQKITPSVHFFCHCPNLREIVFPERAKKYCSRDGLVLSADGKQLIRVLPAHPRTEVVVPEGVTVVFDHAFEGCTRVEKVVFPSTLEKISFQYIRNDTSLKEAEIASGNDHFFVRDGVFYGEGGSVLLGAVKPPRHLTIPESVRKIEAYAFKGIPLQSVVFPHSLEEIGKEAFAGTDIEQITLFPGVKKLDNRVFQGCKQLRTVRFSSGLESVGERIFDGCFALEEIYCPDMTVEQYNLMTLGTGTRYTGHYFAAIVPKATLDGQDLVSKVQLTQGFARAYARGEAGEFEDQEQYLKYIQKSIRYLPGIFLGDVLFEEPTLLQLMLEKKWLNGKQTDLVLEDERCNAEMKAALLTYKRDVLMLSDDPDKNFAAQMRALERAASGKRTVADWQKEWDYVKTENGTIELRQYKGNSSVITVPDKIGRTPVTAIANDAFSEACRKGLDIERIVLPAGIQGTEAEAFDGLGDHCSIEVQKEGK